MKLSDKWTIWFAWYPVIAINHDEFPYKEDLIWFRKVWRRKFHDNVYNKDYMEYKLMDPKPVDKNDYWKY
jgi:hypothetical protein